MSAQDGHDLWRVDLPAENGYNQRSDTRARYTPDGLCAYMLTFTATGDNDTSASFLYALDTAGGATTTDTVTITAAQYVTSRSQLTVKATDSDPSAVLQAYITSSDTLLGTLKFRRGAYVGKFSLSSNPGSVTVKSGLGGSATKTAKVR